MQPGTDTAVAQRLNGPAGEAQDQTNLGAIGGSGGAKTLAIPD